MSTYDPFKSALIAIVNTCPDEVEDECRYCQAERPSYDETYSHTTSCPVTIAKKALNAQLTATAPSAAVDSGELRALLQRAYNAIDTGWADEYDPLLLTRLADALHPPAPTAALDAEQEQG